MSQNDSTTPPAGAAGGYGHAPYGGPRSGLSGRGAGFFAWIRGLGIVRDEGWIGGVCAGLARRIGIDPLIVRGIVVVLAIVGVPVVLLYAAAWALLPDRTGRIHLESLFEGDVQPPIVAIGVLALLSLLPWSGPWWSGPFWHGPTAWDVIWRIVGTLIVIGLVITVVAIAANAGSRRGWLPPSTPAGPTPPPAGAPASGAAESRTADPAASAAADTVAAPASSTGAGSDPAPGDAAADADTAVLDTAVAGAGVADTAAMDTLTLDVSAEPSPPPAPGVDASVEDVSDWRSRQAQWQAEHAQWKQRLAEDMRAVKVQRSAELKAQASLASAQAAARRRQYQAANPRVGAAFGWATIGIALLAGALTSALWAPVTGATGYALTAAFAAATLMIGIAVLIAGLARRRSGFLIFLGLLLALVTATTALLPIAR